MNSVNVNVLFFAKAREIVGKSEATLSVNQPISYSALLDTISQTFHLNDIKENVILAVNESFCARDDSIRLGEGDNVAVIPPLSGG